MGCLNSNESFSHWFGNIHLSGPCNRSCYFCIGQHMQSLESINILDTWPLPGLGEFFDRCTARGVREVNVTGTNTDPLIYRHAATLFAAIRERGFVVGVRTNAAANLELLRHVDKGSASIHSLDPAIYRAIMGSGHPPDVVDLVQRLPRIKVNIVLCPENRGDDLMRTIDGLVTAGVQTINLREPYGQPYQGDPFANSRSRVGGRFGMPVYEWHGAAVTYWDVHYVEVESVNLYANGTVSDTYPITKGYDAIEGKVLDQSNWTVAKRHLPQWGKT